MKVKLLILVIGFLVIFLSCGQEPPPPFFTGSKDDSLKIKELLKESKVLEVPLFESVMFGDDFLKEAEFRRSPYFDTLLKKDRGFMKFFPQAFGRKAYSQRDSFKIIFIKDTTCHVYLIREFKDSLYILTCSITPYLPDSRYYANRFVAKETLIKKPFNAISWQVAFFEPVKKDTEPREWVLKKISGCQIINSPDVENAPIFYDRDGRYFGVIVSSRAKTCTIFALEYQRIRDPGCSLKFSNRRLFYVVEGEYEKKDSLLYLPLDSLKISCRYWLHPDDSVYTYVYYKDREQWQRIPSFKKFMLKEGFNRFYVEGITYECLTHIKKLPRAIIWGISCYVK